MAAARGMLARLHLLQLVGATGLEVSLHLLQLVEVLLHLLQLVEAKTGLEVLRGAMAQSKTFLANVGMGSLALIVRRFDPRLPSSSPSSIHSLLVNKPSSSS